MDKVHILGIPLDNLDALELKRAVRRLFHRHRGHIVTPNPEFLLKAQHDSEFFSALEKADLSIPDGIGLKFAGWLRGQNLKRYTGSNFVLQLLSLADKQHLRVAIINWSGGLSNDSEILAAIKKRHPKLSCFVVSVDRDDNGYQAQPLRNFKPDIVFVALGAPWQESFIRRRVLRDLPKIRFAMGVGGSFDFLTGRLKRAPRVFQVLGFEWLWRLILQPWRIKRIWNAVVVFPFSVVAWEFRRFRFRYNVMALIINQYEEALILNRIGRYDYWGLPQGGIERNENMHKAMEREVFEETGLRDLQVLGKFENIYSYIWPKHYTRRGYKGQRQSLFIVRYNGPRNAVRLDRFEHKAYRWVPLSKFISSVSSVHRKGYQVFLQKYYEIQRRKH